MRRGARGSRGVSAFNTRGRAARPPVGRARQLAKLASAESGRSRSTARPPDGWTGRVEESGPVATPDAAAARSHRPVCSAGAIRKPPAEAGPHRPRRHHRRRFHTVKLSRETAGRRGKGVDGRLGVCRSTRDQLKDLAAQVEEQVAAPAAPRRTGAIEIQGDHRDRHRGGVGEARLQGETRRRC